MWTTRNITVRISSIFSSVLSILVMSVIGIFVSMSFSDFAAKEVKTKCPVHSEKHGQVDISIQPIETSNDENEYDIICLSRLIIPEIETSWLHAKFEDDSKMPPIGMVIRRELNSEEYLGFIVLHNPFLNSGPEREVRIWYSGLDKMIPLGANTKFESNNSRSTVSVPFNDQIGKFEQNIIRLAYSEKAYIDMGSGSLEIDHEVKFMLREMVKVWQNHKDQLN